jgi:hypothetical protein
MLLKRNIQLALTPSMYSSLNIKSSDLRMLFCLMLRYEGARVRKYFGRPWIYIMLLLAREGGGFFFEILPCSSSMYTTINPVLLVQNNNVK